MAPKHIGFEWTEDSHLDETALSAIERGDVDQRSHPELHQHLREVCQTCDDFMAGQVSLKDTDDYDLNDTEVDRILQTILDETEDDRLRLAQAAAAPSWGQQLQQWLWGWRATVWAVPAMAALLFVVLPPSMGPGGSPAPGSQTPQDGCEGRKNCRQGGTGAFLHVTVDRRRGDQTARLRPFTQDATYQVGDAMLFRFQVINDGYLVLVRQDAQGHIEQIYPFPKHGPLRASSGQAIRLTFKGQPLAYYLEPKHEGKQIFRLLHVEKPTRFPSHVSKLSKAQKKIFAQADFMRFHVHAAPRPR